MEKRQWLIDVRKQKGMTQIQAADALGIYRSLYCQIELGYRPLTLAKAKRISIVLDVPWDKFRILE